MIGRGRRPAFGVVECVLALALIGLATWGVAATMLRQAETPPWVREARGVWV